jgi:anti-anti-sigma factor
MGWALREPGGSDLMLGCEQGFEAAVAPSTMTMAICQVDRSSCSPDELTALRNTHEVLVEVNPEFDDGILKITRTFAPHGLRLEGELDGARHAVFAETLSSVAVPKSKVHLDFTRLSFIDLGALNLLAIYAMRMPGGSGLVLDNLRPDVEQVIEMVGWHRLPGISRGQGERS